VRKILFTAFLVLLFPAMTHANGGDIKIGSYFECQSIEALRVDAPQTTFKKQREQTFTLRVGESNLEFISSSASYNAGERMNKKYHQPHLTTGYNENSAFAMERADGWNKFRFYYSSTTLFNIFSMFGYCQKLQ